MDSFPISACIITYNEQDRIGDCLTSLAFCDEIVVVDSGSEDATCDLARKAGARVLVRPFAGFRSQKRFAVEQASHDWILSLDADERVDAKLRQSIETARTGGFAGAAGYRFNRTHEYFGKRMKHGNSRRNYMLRLFNRQKGGWYGQREVHESVILDGPIKYLDGNLLHFPYRSLSEQSDKLERYAQMMAEDLYAKHKKASLAKILFNPGWRFMRSYVLRCGFLDGWRGLVNALMSSESARRKYLKLWLLEHGYKP
jgi:glycosyltransferase involved in cell wall biosynthesis